MRFFALLAATAAATSVDADADGVFLEKFREFVKKFEKEYESVEHMIERLMVFRKNLPKIEEAAKKDKASGKYSHLSKYADWTEEEFNARNTLKKPANLKDRQFPTLSLENVPESYDWRDHGAVNAVKDQGQCGSCWSFGTVANIEGAYVVQGGNELYSLAEQELVDCDTVDQGCNGGLPSNAYEWLISGNTKLDLESDYKYTAQDGFCAKDEYTGAVGLSTWTNVSDDEDQIKAALIQYGPLAIGINAGPMQFYFGGVADPADCDPSGIDHAVNIVGYGTDDGQDYWLIRNSWGESWGEDGYYRIVRGVGACGLNSMVTSATYESKKVENQEIII